MDLRRYFEGAFRRNSTAISFLILASLIAMALSTAYFLTAHSGEQFENLVAVEQYDNALTEVTALDEWSRTKFYWSNNLGVAGLCALTFPTYLGANSAVFNGYYVGMALVYNYHAYGPAAMLAFAGVIFVHGVLELTGFFIIGAASLRLAWKFWGYFGHALKGGFGKMTKKRKAAVERYLSDYAAMIGLGMFMIFLAAPIEAYVSPYIGAVFLLVPPLALFYLSAALFFYYSLIRRGFMPVRRAFVSAVDDAKAFLSGKWRPGSLSLIMLLVFSLIWLWSLF